VTVVEIPTALSELCPYEQKNHGFTNN
jgi:hypothetical protein